MSAEDYDDADDDASHADGNADDDSDLLVRQPVLFPRFHCTHKHHARISQCGAHNSSKPSCRIRNDEVALRPVTLLQDQKWGSPSCNAAAGSEMR